MPPDLRSSGHKNNGQYLQTYWTATGTLLDFMNTKWTIVYKAEKMPSCCLLSTDGTDAFPTIIIDQ